MKTYPHIKYARKQLSATRKLIKYYAEYPLKSIPRNYDENMDLCPLCKVSEEINKDSDITNCDSCLWILIWGKQCIQTPTFSKQQTRTRLHRLRVFEKVLKNQISKSKGK